jgi:uncharacterized iron-regulated protein
LSDSNGLTPTQFSMKKFLLIFLLFPLLSKAQKQLTENNYRIYSVKIGKAVALKDIAADMNNYSVLFFGEEHNDSVTHFLELSMLALLYEKFSDRVALSMEMFDRDVQPVMNEYLGGFIREKQFIKDARAWPNYRDYRPMVEFAKDKMLQVVCGNAASRYSNLAGRRGEQGLKELPEASKAFFAPLPYDTATGAYYEKLMGIPEHAAGTVTPDTAKAKAMAMPGIGNFNLVVAQSLWDATMAYSIAQYHNLNPQKKIMQVNGKFHSDERFAVVAQLKKYSPKLKVLVISTAQDDNFPNINWREYAKMGDYIIITDPKVPRSYKD